MTEAVTIALIAVVPPTAVALLSVALSIRTHGKLNELHVQINSRMDNWLSEAKAASRSEGRAEGVQEERDRP